MSANSTGSVRISRSLDREIAESALDDAAIKRLLTITGVNLTVAAGLMAAIGDIARFTSPQKLVSYFGLNPRVRQSGLGAAHHGRISKVGRSHARAMLVEAAWAAAKAPGPLHAFFVRIRARRGHQIAAVAVARKLAVLCWHMLTKETDYLWARPSLVAHKRRAMELQAGRPQKKGNARGPPTPTTSRRCATRRCASPSRPRRATSSSSRPGAAPAKGADRAAGRAEHLSHRVAGRQRQRCVNARWRPATPPAEVRGRLHPARSP